MKAFIAVLILAMLLASAACSKGVSVSNETARPTPTMPPSFVNFTDESEVFSISYPEGWSFTRLLHEGATDRFLDIAFIPLVFRESLIEDLRQAYGEEWWERDRLDPEPPGSRSRQKPEKSLWKR